MRPAVATPINPAPVPGKAAPAAGIRFQSGEQEMALRVDLSDLVLPKVDNLHVDGLQRPWWARLFGK